MTEEADIAPTSTLLTGDMDLGVDSETQVTAALQLR